MPHQLTLTSPSTIMGPASTMSAVLGMSHSLRARTNVQKGLTAMTRAFDVVIERDAEGYYVASVPELAGCHTQAKSLDALMKRIREAIELCLDVEQEDITPREFIGVQRVMVEA